MLFHVVKDQQGSLHHSLTRDDLFPYRSAPAFPLPSFILSHSQKLKRSYMLGGKRSYVGIPKVFFAERNSSFKPQESCVLWMHKVRTEALSSPRCRGVSGGSPDALRQQLFLMLIVSEWFPRRVSNM